MWFPPVLCCFFVFLIITFLFLAPALCYTGQLVMLLPQLAQTLPFLLQAGLQLQNQNLRTNTISLAIPFWVFSSYNKQTEQKVLRLLQISFLLQVEMTRTSKGNLFLFQPHWRVFKH